ncbi:MAG: hypothetical protein R3A44_34675 [Caldilineaceae bacterium]
MATIDRTQSGRWLIPLLLAAFALQLYQLDKQNIWWDEARNIDVALRPFGQIATAPELDIHPPVYFWMLHVWGRLAGLPTLSQIRLPPEQVAFLTRFLSVCMGVLSVALLYALVQQAARRMNAPLTAALWAAIVAALSPFWLAESQETRMYTVEFAFLLAAAIPFLHLLYRPAAQSQNRRRFGPTIPFVLFSALALLTHYNAVFILMAWYGCWLLAVLTSSERMRELRTLMGCGLTTALLFAPITPIALRQIPGYENPNLIVPSMGEYLSQNWFVYLGGYAFTDDLLQVDDRAFGQLWAWLLLLIFGVGLIFLWLRANRSTEKLDSLEKSSFFTNIHGLLIHPLTFLLVWLLGGLALYYIAVLDRGAFNPRYSSFVTPALYALMGLGLAGWQRMWPPLAAAGIVLLLLGTGPAVWADQNDAHFGREDMAGVTDWLRQNATADDLILVDQKYPFGFYYQRYSLDPAQAPSGPEAATARYLFVDINTVDQQLTAWAQNARRIFWVRWFESDTDPRHAVTFLLDQAGQRTGEKDFRGYSIDWWELTPPNHFELAPNLQPATYIFPPALETVAISAPTEAIQPGAAIPVVIRWQRVTEGWTDRPLKARVAIYNANGSRKAQADARLLNDRHVMPGQWGPTDQPFNVYRLNTEADLKPGPYELRLLVYDEETLEPLTLVDAAGNPAGQEAVIGIINVK